MCKLLQCRVLVLHVYFDLKAQLEVISAALEVLAQITQTTPVLIVLEVQKLELGSGDVLWMTSNCMMEVIV